MINLINGDCLISPIFYMGNKRKLIKKGLIDLFPENINTFYDLFGGSGVVSLNTSANQYVLNDLDLNVYNFYKLFNKKDDREIIGKILNNLDDFDLLRIGIKQGTEKAEKYKQHYYELRKKANISNSVIDLYTCMFYAFSQQMRFNQKGKFNMPFGNGAFTEKNEEYIKIGCDFFSQKNLMLYNKNYLDFDITDANDFVYLDPPYFNTIATYNESSGWNDKNENDLYDFILRLNNKGIKFGMSNTLFSKGVKNKRLYDFCIDNDFLIYHFENFNYQSCGKINKVDEVYICNYKLNKNYQPELF